MKKNLFQNSEIAQIIPIVVIGVLIIIMLSAVIVDGGSLLSNRRSAQAAADAGALAGAKQLCAEDSSATRTAARNTAYQYVTSNNAAFSSEPTFSTVSISGHDVLGITVYTNVTNESFFARALGEYGLTAGAKATAGCYHPSQTVHLIPLAFYYNSPPVNAGDADCDTNGTCDLVNYDFTELMTLLQATAAKDQPLDDIYVIMNEVKICEKNSIGEIVCVNMAKNASGGSRAWIDLTELSEGANLKQIFAQGVTSDLFLPAWLNEQPGVSADVYNNRVYENLPAIGGYETSPYRMVLVPVFDNFCSSGQPWQDCLDKFDSDDRIEYLISASQPSYRLVGLAPFVITCVTKNNGADFGQAISKHDLPSDLTNPWKNKDQCPGYLATGHTENDAIEGYFVTGTPLDAYATGTGGVSAGMDIVSLTQ